MMNENCQTKSDNPYLHKNFLIGLHDKSGNIDSRKLTNTVTCATKLTPIVVFKNWGFNRERVVSNSVLCAYYCIMIMDKAYEKFNEHIAKYPYGHESKNQISFIKKKFVNYFSLTFAGDTKSVINLFDCIDEMQLKYNALANDTYESFRQIIGNEIKDKDKLDRYSSLMSIMFDILASIHIAHICMLDNDKQQDDIYKSLVKIADSIRVITNKSIVDRVVQCELNLANHANVILQRIINSDIIDKYMV